MSVVADTVGVDGESEEAEEGTGAELVVVDGRDKPFRTTLSDSDYTAVRAMGEKYLRRNPRSIV